MPLRESLESILEDLDHAKLREVLQRVTDRLSEGQAFSQTLMAEGTVFPKLSLALMRTAEEMGTMAKTLDDLGHHAGEGGCPDAQDQQHHGLSDVRGRFFCRDHDHHDLFHPAAISDFCRMGHRASRC